MIDHAPLLINPTPLYELSPYLYMQFMEPLGATDGSVSAAWDFQQDAWRKDVIRATQELGPTMLRWGGVLAPTIAGKRALVHASNGYRC